MRYIIKEEVLKNKLIKTIDEKGLLNTMKYTGLSWAKLTSLIGMDFITNEIMVDFITQVMREIEPFGLSEVNEDPIFYNQNSEEVREITYLGTIKVVVDVWSGPDFNEHEGEFGVSYHNLSDHILEQVFDVIMKVYEENKDI